MTLKHHTARQYFPDDPRKTAALLAHAMSPLDPVEIGKVINLSFLCVGESINVIATDGHSVIVNWYKRIA